MLKNWIVDQSTARNFTISEKFYYISAFLKTLVFLSLADVDTPPLLATAQ